MMIKIAGAILILIGCGGVGYLLSSSHRNTTKLMQDLIAVLEYIECEIQYRQSPLPDVFRRAVPDDGLIRKFFYILSEELEGQIAPDVECCIIAALSRVKELPNLAEAGILKLGRCLGRFDLDGQIKGLTSVREECTQMLCKHMNNQDVRIRNYHTLALCAGAALLIFLL